MNQPLDKAVTVRFSRADYLQLQQQAEQQGCSIADIVRKSFTHYQQQQQLQQHLLKAERRQYKTTFAMLCAVVGLDQDERMQAAKQLQAMGVKW